MFRSRHKFKKALSSMLLVSSLIVGGISTGPALSSSAASAPIKIMCVGDSCTEGMGDPDMGSYRTELYNLYKKAGIDFDFVGSNKRGPNSLPDKDNEGHSGWTISGVANNINNWMNTQNPDVILLWIGGNDLLQGGKTNPTGLSNLIDQIFKQNSNITLFVSDYYPVPDSVTKYNSEIPGVIQQKVNEGKKVYFNKMSSMNFVRSTDLSNDGLHLSVNGYIKAANIWYDSTISVLKSMSVSSSPTNKPTDKPTNTPIIVNPVPEDVNGDKVVNMADVMLIALHFNTVRNDSNYDISCDINNDGSINMGDVIMIASKFNYSY